MSVSLPMPAWGNVVCPRESQTPPRANRCHFVQQLAGCPSQHADACAQHFGCCRTWQHFASRAQQGRCCSQQVRPCGGEVPVRVTAATAATSKEETVWNMSVSLE